MSPRIKLLAVIVMIFAPFLSAGAEWKHQRNQKAQAKIDEEMNQRDMAATARYRAWNEIREAAERLLNPNSPPEDIYDQATTQRGDEDCNQQ